VHNMGLAAVHCTIAIESRLQACRCPWMSLLWQKVTSLHFPMMPQAAAAMEKHQPW